MPGPVAMLAATMGPGDFDTVSQPAWAMEPKIDGHRLLVTTGPDGPAAFNRQGVERALPATLQPVFAQLDNHATFDGEWARGRYHVFDLPSYDDVVTHDLPWAHRQIALRKLFDLWAPPPALVERVPHVRESKHKMALLARMREEGGEGVVAKRIDSPYEPGRKSPSWLKWKLLKHVDVVVIGAGHEGKRNLTLGMIDPTGDLLIPGGRGREVGRCSALTGDGPRVQFGDVVTVTVTGVGAAGRLVEPVTPRLRCGDKRPEDCTIDQLDEIRGISR